MRSTRLQIPFKKTEREGFFLPRCFAPPPKPAGLTDIHFVHSSSTGCVRLGFKSLLKKTERVGFEPTGELLTLHTISNRALSASQSPLPIVTVRLDCFSSTPQRQPHYFFVGDKPQRYCSAGARPPHF